MCVTLFPISEVDFVFQARIKRVKSFLILKFQCKQFLSCIVCHWFSYYKHLVNIVFFTALEHVVPRDQEGGRVGHFYPRNPFGVVFVTTETVTLQSRTNTKVKLKWLNICKCFFSKSKQMGES